MRYVSALAVLLFFGLTSCTRDLGDDAKVRLNFPQHSGKISSMALPADFKLVHIVVNVRNPQGSLILYNWDAECGDGCLQSPPTEIVLDVQTGAGQLIQYMGVYKSMTTEAMIFTYGDVTKDIEPGVVYAEILATTYGDPVSGVEGEVTGQYVTTVSADVGYGPTGRLSIEFEPPTGAPAMEIMQTEMFNGWFNLFTLEGVPFIYRLASTGEVIFSNMQPSTLDSSLSTKLLKISAPEYSIYDDCGGGCTPRWENGRSGVFYLGFFGPAVGDFTTAPIACYDPATTYDLSVNGLYQTDQSTPLYWKSSADANNVSRDGGGTTTCSGVEWETNAKFDPYMLKWDIRDGFKRRGPFALGTYSFTDTNCNRTNTFGAGCYSSGNIEVQWSYISKVGDGPNGIDGVTIFTRPQDSSLGFDDEEFRDRNVDHGYLCSKLSSMGFISRGDYTLPTSAASWSETLASGTQLVTILCPYSLDGGLKKYFSTALNIHDIGNWSGGGGGGGTVTVYGITGGSDVLDDSYLGGGTTNPTVSWGAYSGADHYDVYIRDFSDTTDACTMGTTASTSLSIACALTDGVTYIARVVAYDALSNQIGQGELYFDVDATVPPAPTLSVGSYTNYLNDPYISYNHSGSDFSYVNIKMLDGGIPVTGCDINTTSTSGINLGTGCNLTDGTTYTVEATAYDLADNPSSTATATVLVDATAPTVPSIDLLTTTCTPGAPGSVDITFNHGYEGDLSYFDIYIDGGFCMSPGVAPMTPPQMEMVTCTVSSGDPLMLRVEAFDMAGNMSSTGDVAFNCP